MSTIAGADAQREPRAPVVALVPPPAAAGQPWGGRSGNLAYVTKMFPRVSETFILREILALRRAGVPVRIYSLLAPTRDERVQPEAEALIPEVIVLPEPSAAMLGPCLRELGSALRARPAATLRELARTLLSPSRASWRRLARALALAARLRADAAAHVHAAWAHTPASVTRVACALTGIPWSMGAHAKDIHLSSPKSLRRKLAAVRFTTVCSRSNQALLQQLGAVGPAGLPGPVVDLHYHGVDTDYFVPAARPHLGVAGREVPMVLAVGRLVPKKGFDVLLEAAARLRDRGLHFRLDIVGAGPLRQELMAQAERLGLADRVAFRGMQILDEVRAAYGEARCVVLPSRVAADGDRDGIPNTLAEAMAMGVPVISTAQPAIAELVRNEETGLLVPPDDAEALADALMRVLGDAVFARGLGRAGEQWVRDHFAAAEWGARIACRLERSLGVERVLYVSADRGVPIRGGKGASVHVRSVLKALHGEGVESYLLTTRPGPDDGPDPGVPHLAAESPAWLQRGVRRLAAWAAGGRPLEQALLRLCDNIAIFRQGCRVAQAWHPDFIYERYALTAIAGSLLARRLGVPHFLEVNAPLAEEEARYRHLRLGALARWTEGWLLRRADRVLVVSEALAAHARRLGADPRRILVLPNAVDGELFHPQRDGDLVRRRHGLGDAFVLGFTGTLKSWHGVHHLLRAAAAALPSLPNLKVLIVGEGPERVQLAALAQALGLAERVVFTGHVDHAEVGGYVAACDLLAAPYGPMDDHWFSPLKVAEYLATGKPVVASAIGQLAERTDESVGVLLVPPGDEQALAAALIRVAGDPGLRARLAQGALHARAWTWRTLVRRTLAEAEASRRELWRWTA